MSWSGFTKKMNRATTQVMMKTGHVEKTNDRDYETELRSATPDSYIFSPFNPPGQSCQPASLQDPEPASMGRGSLVEHLLDPGNTSGKTPCLQTPMVNPTSEGFRRYPEQSYLESDSESDSTEEADIRDDEDETWQSSVWAGRQADRPTDPENLNSSDTYSEDEGDWESVITSDSDDGRIDPPTQDFARPHAFPFTFTRRATDSSSDFHAPSLLRSSTSQLQNSILDTTLDLSHWILERRRTSTSSSIETAFRTRDRTNALSEIDTHRRFRTMESAANKLQTEAKGYLDALRAMTASQMRIAETIDAFYGEAGTRDGVSRSYKQAVTDLDAETIKALDGPFRTTVLEPISRFCAYFPDINACITKREHKLLDYDSLRSKVAKLTQKPDKDVTKLPRVEKETEMAKTVYEELNEKLCNELPQIIELRVPYLDPSFEALVKIQLRFCAEAYARMAQVQQYLEKETRDQYAEGVLDSRVEEVLEEIRGLSIAGTV